MRLRIKTLKKNPKSNSNARLVSFQRPLTHCCIVATFLMLVWAACLVWQHLRLGDRFQFHRFEVVMRAQHIDVNAVKAAVVAHLKGNFFTFNFSELKEQLSKNAWVESVSLRRVWPDTLQIRLTEKQPMLRWGAATILSQNGKLFVPTRQSIPEGLPLLIGPKASFDAVLAQYKKMQSVLRPIGLAVTKLVLNDQQSWFADIGDQFFLILGQKGTTEKMKRFVALYPALKKGIGADILNVDLRYPNGAAVARGHGRVKGSSILP